MERGLGYYVARAFVGWGSRWIVLFAIIWAIITLAGGPEWLGTTALSVAMVHLVGLFAWRVTQYARAIRDEEDDL